jgi:hypothetical protein
MNAASTPYVFLLRAKCVTASGMTHVIGGS